MDLDNHPYNNCLLLLWKRWFFWKQQLWLLLILKNNILKTTFTLGSQTVDKIYKNILLIVFSILLIKINKVLLTSSLDQVGNKKYSQAVFYQTHLAV